MTDDTWDSGRRRPAGTGGDRSPDDVGERGRSKDWGGFEESPTVSGLRPAGDSDLAPVIPLFGASARSVGDHPSRRDAVAKTQADVAPPGESTPPPAGRPRLSVVGDDHADEPSAPDRAEIRERAEAILLRKLRSRSLSLSEARGVVRGVDGADEPLADELLDHLVDLGYLDDAAFAEQLAMSAVERKGEGRRAVAETLRKRGIPRDIAEATLAELPDDDAERALDFARSKVRGVEGKEYDAALRRLAGQLSRRGYPSSVALTAARTALEEAGIGRSRSFSPPASGVRFTPDS
jgi:SOS response regulatory protein OraA/RecX